eukprot:m.84311 g.84311  ORF g.84311 m.84311 type:complete len:68 (+) comp36404_c0_seq5:1461-1664(+)
MHPSTHIDGVKKLALNVPSDSNGIHVNAARVAFPLAGPGGQIAVLEVRRGETSYKAHFKTPSIVIHC